MKLLIILIIICVIYLFYTNKSTQEHLTDDVSSVLADLNKRLLVKFSRLNTHGQLSIANKQLGNIHIYFINLEKSVDRRNHMVSQFAKFNINNYTRIDAVNGYDYKTNTGRLHIKDAPDLFFKTNYTGYLPGELGATLSHLKTIYMAYNTGHNNILILEDDVSFNLMPFWNTNLHAIMSAAPDDWTIITLFSSNPSCANTTQKYLHFNNYNCYGALAYIINRKGMSNILKCFKDNTFDIDKNTLPLSGSLAADVYLYHKAINTYTYTEYPLFYTFNNIQRMNSTIHTTHTNGHINKAIRTIKTYLYMDNNIRTIWQTTNNTPKRIHQIWDNKKLPESIQHKINKCTDLYKNWEYKLWDIKQCVKLLKYHYNWFIPHFNTLNDADKIGVLKYFILFHYGGIYLDIEYECVKNIEQLIKPGIAYFYFEKGSCNPNCGLTNQILITPIKHPIYEYFIHNIQPNNIGNTYITNAVNNYDLRDIIILDKATF